MMACGVCFALVAFSTGVLKLGFLWEPDLIAAWRHGRKFRVPDAVNPFALRTYLADQERQLGSTHFASEDAYGPAEGFVLSAEQRQAYLREGYLVLRGLVPRRTALALREELLKTLGYLSNPYNENAWFMSDALMDFLVFGPFGRVAAQVLGVEGVHLVYSNMNLRRSDWPAYQAHRKWHWDSIQCCAEHFVPAHMTLITNTNFQIALYDDMPGMHFVNQSSLERVIEAFGNKVNASHLKDTFLKGHLSREFPQALLSHVGQEPFNQLATKPRLNAGDAIVHSPAMIHRSPDGYGSQPSGWLLPCYAASSARFMPIPYLVDRQCDAGDNLELHRHTDHFQRIDTASVPRLADSQRLACFPKVHPPASARSQVGKYKLSFRRETYAGVWAGAFTWFRLSQALRRSRAYQGPDAISAREPLYDEPPATHVIDGRES